MSNYVTYHLHTEQSLLDSCTNYKDYVNKAVELGQKAIAFTEHGNLYTWVEKKMYCDAHDIKYIHGVEAYLTQSLLDADGNKIRDNYHTVLLAKNYDGVKELNRLCYNASMKDHFYYKPRISFEEFLAISDNIIKISACLASPLHAYMSGDIKLSEDFITHYDYYEIQPHDAEVQCKYNAFLSKLAKKYHKPLIMGTDTHSINQYKAECRTLFQYAQEIAFENEDTFDLTYKTYDDLVRLYNGCISKDEWMQAIENTNVMADSVEPFELDKAFKYPILYGENDESVLWDRLRKKYIEKAKNGGIVLNKAQQYGEQIKEEMRVFKKLGMNGFMLFMSELISWCKENNIPVGFGRGSCCGSVVAYVSDITDVDPIVWDTIFSRFCNENRVSLGDIDCDFAPTDRPKVFQYIIDRFGKEFTGYVFSNGTLQEKGAIEEIARGLNNKWKLKHGYKMKDKVEDAPYPIKLVNDIKALYEENPSEAKQKYKDIFYYLDGMNGVVKSSSFHPAGIIASPVNLIDNYGGFVNDNGQTVLPINMEECHDINLVKFDILGLNNVQIIRDACYLAHIDYPKSYQIDFNDEKVWKDIISSPIGIFQFEGNFAYDSLKKFMPIKLDDMTLVTASIRPSGASYRDRLFNHEFNQNPSKQIDELLKNNNGFLVYQEDILRFLQEICGMSGSDADTIRRAIGNKDAETMHKYMPLILEGYCNKSDKPRNVAEEEAKIFLQIIEDASSYMFGRNHATAYSMISYMCGWLRCYYPLEFTTSLLNNANNNDDTLNGTKLAQEKGIKISTPKFGFAQNEYSCNKATNTIYKGLGSIKDMQSIAADIMLEIASYNPKTFVDILYLTDEIKIDGKKINSKSMEILIEIGFFDAFGTISKCKRLMHWYKKVGTKKSMKKDNFDSWLVEIARNHCEKETEKTLTKLDSRGIMYEINEKIVNVDEDLTKLVKYQIEHLGFSDMSSTDIKPNIYLVQDIHDDKYHRTWIKLHQLCSNISKEYEVDKNFAKTHKPIIGDILKVVFGNKPKYMKVDNGWKKTGELKTFVKFYAEWKQ